jgi:peptide/nickel transport system permease protein
MVSVLEPSVTNVTLALAFVSIPAFIRLVRANTLLIYEREFVTAARAIGAKNRRIIWSEIAPNLLAPTLSYAFVLVAVLIVAEASLSFLGLGVRRPTPTWGNMIAAGQSTYQQTPHLVLIPALVLFLTVFSMNAIGERARSRWVGERSPVR